MAYCGLWPCCSADSEKIRLPNLAGDESSDDDSVNCSEINAVTWFGIFSGFLKIFLYFSHRPIVRAFAISILRILLIFPLQY